MTEEGEPTAYMEDKYDGVRCQLHKVGERVTLFSRDLKNITPTFNEIADAARKLKADVILDGEIVAMRGEEMLPFAELQKRLGRKEDDLFLNQEIPVQFVGFDLLWKNGSSYLNHALSERRRELERLSPLPHCLRLALVTPVHSPEETEAAFAAARDRGNEGLMIKTPTVFTRRVGEAWPGSS